MTSTTPLNGRPQRKQLSDQLDRFDAILDGLSEGLNESITDAVRDGVRFAIKDAIVEILTDPNLRTKLHQASGPDGAMPAKKPGVFARLLTSIRSAVGSLCQSAANLAQSTVATVVTTGQAVRDTARGLNTLTNLRLLTLVGLLIGLMVGTAVFSAPQPVAAAISGVSSGLTAMAVQLGVAARRAFRAMILI